MQDLKLIAIAAMSANRVIGAQGDLPWSLPEDLRFFRDQTKNHICIFGRKTMASLGRALPNRLSIVISRDTDLKLPEGVLLAHSLDQALDIARQHSAQYGSDIYICGGGEIYKQALPRLDVLLLTRIHHNVEGDALFPDFSETDFELVEKRDRSDPFSFSFERWVRRL